MKEHEFWSHVVKLLLTVDELHFPSLRMAITQRKRFEPYVPIKDRPVQQLDCMHFHHIDSVLHRMREMEQQHIQSRMNTRCLLGHT